MSILHPSSGIEPPCNHTPCQYCSFSLQRGRKYFLSTPDSLWCAATSWHAQDTEESGSNNTWSLVTAPDFHTPETFWHLASMYAPVTDFKWVHFVSSNPFCREGRGSKYFPTLGIELDHVTCLADKTLRQRWYGRRLPRPSEALCGSTLTSLSFCHLRVRRIWSSCGLVQHRY